MHVAANLYNTIFRNFAYKCNYCKKLYYLYVEVEPPLYEEVNKTLFAREAYEVALKGVDEELKASTLATTKRYTKRLV